MKTFWWIYDEHGIVNFFDTHEAFRYARQHVDVKVGSTVVANEVLVGVVGVS